MLPTLGQWDNMIKVFCHEPQISFTNPAQVPLLD